MNSGIQLNPRLETVAALVRPRVRFVDIGTDHAYLPIALLLRGAVTSAVAADLREGPLAHARQNAVNYGVTDRLQLRCCDGLSQIDPNEAEDIAIAGMGGELIAEILRAAPWVKDPCKHLILQPMSSAEDLRRFLMHESFFIESETAVRDNDRVYTVISAYYSTEQKNTCNDGFDYIGCLNVTASAEAAEYAERQLRHLSKILHGQQLREDPNAAYTLAEIRGIASRMPNGTVVFSADIYNEIDHLAPFHTAMSFDNVGLLVGGPNQIVTKALLALDITPAVVREAALWGAELIISHHPVIFEPIKALTDTHPAYMLAKHRIAAICAHTNLDMADGGVNTCLAQALGLRDCTAFAYYEGCAEGLIGTLEHPLPAAEFATAVRTRLKCGSVQLVDCGTMVQRVALCSGSGGDLLQQAKQAGADAYVTGEARHHQLLEAKALDLNLVIAGHHRTECVVLLPLCEKLQQVFPNVTFRVSEAGEDPTISV